MKKNMTENIVGKDSEEMKDMIERLHYSESQENSTNQTL